jgi:hypothetical protein
VTAVRRLVFGSAQSGQVGFLKAPYVDVLPPNEAFALGE